MQHFLDMHLPKQYIQLSSQKLDSDDFITLVYLKTLPSEFSLSNKVKQSVQRTEALP